MPDVQIALGIRSSYIQRGIAKTGSAKTSTRAVSLLNTDGIHSGADMLGKTLWLLGYLSNVGGELLCNTQLEF